MFSNNKMLLITMFSNDNKMLLVITMFSNNKMFFL